MTSLRKQINFSPEQLATALKFSVDYVTAMEAGRKQIIHATENAMQGLVAYVRSMRGVAV